MQGINCVKGEIHNVLTGLRLSNAHAHHDIFAREHPVVSSLKRLHETLSDVHELGDVDTVQLVTPFIHVISTDHANFRVKTMALRALHKLLLYNYISEDSAPNVAAGLALMAEAVVKCEFNSSQMADNEIICMRVLEVLIELMQCHSGHLLSDAAVCSMAAKCFQIRNQKYASELLRTFSESVLLQLILIVFARLNPETNTGGKAIIPLSADPTAAPPTMLHSDTKSSNKTDPPYGIPCLARLLQVAAGFLNPNDENVREVDCILGLRLVQACFESAGAHLGNFPLLVTIVQDEICKYLLQRSQTRNVYIFSLTLRLVFDMFVTVKQHLKVQLEVFFTSIHLRIGNNPGTTVEQRLLVFESLKEFCIEPSLIAGLYRNYDCEVGSTNLFEDLCKFLVIAATPDAHTGTLNVLNVKALDCLLHVMSSIAKRFRTEDAISALPLPKKGLTILSPKRSSSFNDVLPMMNEEQEQAIQKRHQAKKRLHLASQRFNRDGYKSFEFLQSLKLLPATVTAASVVGFIKTTPGLDKARIGEVLGGSKPLCKDILVSYVDQFDFKNEERALYRSTTPILPTSLRTSSQSPSISHDTAKILSIDEALRLFLNGFQLPGEAQQIERVIEAFATGYYEYAKNSHEQKGSTCILRNVDSAFILLYSIIMLNTDAHNDQVAKKMTKEEFLRNNRLTNDGQDFPPEYLGQIYDNITVHEIKMNPSHGAVGPVDNEAALFSDSRWEYLAHRTRNAGKFDVSVPFTAGKEMFLLVWDSAVQLFTVHLLQRDIYDFENYKSDNSLPGKLLKGFHNFATICAVYDRKQIFNSMIIVLAKGLCDILQEISHEPNPLHAFGLDRRGPTVAKLLFRLAREFGGILIYDGWTNIVHALLWFRKLNFFPPAFTELEDFLDEKGQPLDSLRKPTATDAKTKQAKKGSGGGFMSSAFSYLWVGGGDEDEPVVADDDTEDSKKEIKVDWEMEAKTALAECKFVELFESTNHFRPQCLAYLINAITIVSSYSFNDDVNKFNVFDADVMDEEASVFALERLSDIVQKNQHRLSSDPDLPLATVVKNHCSAALLRLRNAAPSFYLERLIVTVLRFSVRLGCTLDATKHIIDLLRALSTLPDSLFVSFGERICYGLHVFFTTHGDSIILEDDWAALLNLLTRFKTEALLSKASFATLTYLVDNHARRETFKPLIMSLVSFCQPGSVETWQAISPIRCLTAMLTLHAKLATFESITKSIPEDLSSEERSVGEVKTQEVSTPKTDKEPTGESFLQLWQFSLSMLCGLCLDSRPSVNEQAVEFLQKALLAGGVTVIDSNAWRTCFDSLLLPLLSKLTDIASSPQAPASKDAIDVRQVLVGTIIRSFLHNLNCFLALPDFHIFWLGLLNGLIKYIKACQEDKQAVFHATQQLQNTFLVLHGDGVFDRARKETGQDLLPTSFVVIESVLPDFKRQFEELIAADKE